MKKLSFLVMTFALIFLLGSPALAQQFDLSAGVSGLTGPSSTADLQTIGGGAYPTFGLDFLFFHNLGVGFNAAFRAKQNLYQGQLPFRPFFYDVDAVFVSSNHFLGQFGAAIRLYVTPKIFIRPEAHLYEVHNNIEFSGSRATRFGFSIGYSFKNQE